MPRPVAPAAQRQSEERTQPTTKHKGPAEEKSGLAAATTILPATTRCNEFAALAKIAKTVRSSRILALSNPCADPAAHDLDNLRCHIRGRLNPKHRPPRHRLQRNSVPRRNSSLQAIVKYHSARAIQKFLRRILKILVRRIKHRQI